MSLQVGRPTQLTKRVRLRLRRPTALLTFLLLALVFTVLLSQLRFDAYGSSGIKKLAEKVPIAVQKKERSDFTLQPRVHAHREPRTLIQHWRITTDHKRPDGVLQPVYLINGEFPGPTVEARPGDRLIIEIENALKANEEVGLQWHGLSALTISSLKDPHQSIRPGESFIHNLTIDASEHGTFWYSATDPKQRASGLYGGVIIHALAADKDVQHLDEEYLLLISEWYHSPVEDLLRTRSSSEASDISLDIPDSVIINGVGQFPCANASSPRLIDCTETSPSGTPTIHLTAGKRNVMRVINVSAHSNIEMALHGSMLTALSVNGNSSSVSSPSESITAIYPEQRMDVLVQLNAVIAHYRSQLDFILYGPDSIHENTFRKQPQPYPVRWFGI